MSRRLQTTHITGCYEYRAPIRRLVNVELYEKRENEKSMTHTTTTTSTSDFTAMGNGNKKSTSHSFSADNLSNHSSKSTNNKDVAKWSSTDVQHWVKKHCKKYELKKTTAEKFEMNGQALMLLNKHDFIRRSPDGGEVLYYALQHLINPNKANSVRLDQSLSKDGSSSQHPRIVEISEDTDEFNGATDSSSPKPIVEEPDDPPIIRRSQSDTHYDNHHQQQPHAFFFHQAQLRPTVLTMSAGSAAAFFNQQQGAPNTYMYGHPHPHLHMHQPFFFQPHLLHTYHPMMSAQGILIEIMDDTDLTIINPDGVDGPMNGAHESLYIVTINGQRYIMNEDHVKQLVTEVYQRQALQQNLQRQHLQQQQQFFQQQQQQYFQQQQQYFQQQQQQQQQQQNQHNNSNVFSNNTTNTSYPSNHLRTISITNDDMCRLSSFSSKTNFSD